ncbi:hypothetical protein [Neobacillus drentensis]|uniref:hypothetical protein n=1 Tax=Neobacillus drentensis TaxID=220684 RepID=UPI002FFEAC86
MFVVATTSLFIIFYLLLTESIEPLMEQKKKNKTLGYFYWIFGTPFVIYGGLILLRIGFENLKIISVPPTVAYLVAMISYFILLVSEVKNFNPHRPFYIILAITINLLVALYSNLPSDKVENILSDVGNGLSLIIFGITVYFFAGKSLRLVIKQTLTDDEDCVR